MKTKLFLFAVALFVQVCSFAQDNTAKFPLTSTAENPIWYKIIFTYSNAAIGYTREVTYYYKKLLVKPNKDRGTWFRLEKNPDGYSYKIISDIGINLIDRCSIERYKNGFKIIQFGEKDKVIGQYDSYKYDKPNHGVKIGDEIEYNSEKYDNEVIFVEKKDFLPDNYPISDVFKKLEDLFATFKCFPNNKSWDEFDKTTPISALGFVTPSDDDKQNIVKKNDLNLYNHLTSKGASEAEWNEAVSRLASSQNFVLGLNLREEEQIIQAKQKECNRINNIIINKRLDGKKLKKPELEQLKQDLEVLRKEIIHLREAINTEIEAEISINPYTGVIRNGNMKRVDASEEVSSSLVKKILKFPSYTLVLFNKPMLITNNYCSWYPLVLTCSENPKEKHKENIEKIENDYLNKKILIKREIDNNTSSDLEKYDIEKYQYYKSMVRQRAISDEDDIKKYPYSMINIPVEVFPVIGGAEPVKIRSYSPKNFEYTIEYSDGDSLKYSVENVKNIIDSYRENPTYYFNMKEFDYIGYMAVTTKMLEKSFPNYRLKVEFEEFLPKSATYYFNNGDSIVLYKFISDFTGENASKAWKSRVITKKINASNADEWMAQVLDSVNPNFTINRYRLEDIGTVHYSNGKKENIKYNGSDYNENRLFLTETQVKEIERIEREETEAERQRRAKEITDYRRSMDSKYGKYMNSIMYNNVVLIGTPIALLKEMNGCFGDKYYGGTDYDNVYNLKYEGNVNGSDRYTFYCTRFTSNIWVQNGKVVSVRTYLR